MKIICIENKNQRLLAPLQAIYCGNYLCRLCGLMFRYSLPQDKGLLLVRARDSRLATSIHMLFVYMDIAVIWINSLNIVVDTILALSWHTAYASRKAARFILEIHPDRLNEFKFGDHLEIHA